jgi:peptide/nickel transport system permease protein
MAQWTEITETGLAPLNNWSRRFIRIRLRRLLLNLLLRFSAVLLVAAMAMILVRYGPGFETEERDLDPGLSASTRSALHNQRLAEGRLFEYARNFVSRALRGDLGESRTLGVPVRELIAERGPATLRILATGIAVSWLVGLLWATTLVILRTPALAGASTLLNACLLCLPTAAIAALLLNANWPAGMVLAMALLPKVFQVTRGLMMQAIGHSEVLAARARGLRTMRILCWYVLPRIAGPMLAWLAATTGLAIGAVVPIEVICDVPGLGQLAWKAALARDLPVLVVLTILVAIIIQISSSASALVAGSLRGQRA